MQFHRLASQSPLPSLILWTKASGSPSGWRISVQRCVCLLRIVAAREARCLPQQAVGDTGGFDEEVFGLFIEEATFKFLFHRRVEKERSVRDFKENLQFCFRLFYRGCLI